MLDPWEMKKRDKVAKQEERTAAVDAHHDAEKKLPTLHPSSTASFTDLSPFRSL